MSTDRYDTASDELVKRAIIRHEFFGVDEWAAGLDTLASMSEAHLDGLFGVSADQAAADRRLYDRVVAELGEVAE